MRYHGSCHCGAVAYEVEGELEMALSCNCSICSKKGALLWAVPRASLRLKGPDGNAGRYTFNRHALVHRFCTNCGIHPYAEDAGEDEARSAYVNIRCLEGVDPNGVEKMEFDGRAM
jgi:hypothetical protein